MVTDIGNWNWKKVSYIQFLEIRIQNKPKLKLENVNIFSILTLESENWRIYFHV